MPNQLKISIATLSLPIAVFSQDGYDRQLIDSGDTEYSIYGTALDSGPFYEPKFLWTITCFLTKDEYQTLQAIFQYSDQQRRSQQDYRITIDDEIENYSEPGITATRAIVPGKSSTINNANVPGQNPLSGNFANFISYPARFYGRIFNPACKIQTGLRSHLTTFTIKELDRFNS